jgi:hypothetical protein
MAYREIGCEDGCWVEMDKFMIHWRAFVFCGNGGERMGSITKKNNCYLKEENQYNLVS